MGRSTATGFMLRVAKVPPMSFDSLILLLNYDSILCVVMITFAWSNLFCEGGLWGLGGG